MNNASNPTGSNVSDDLERQIGEIFLEIDAADRRIQATQTDIDRLRTETRAILHDLQASTAHAG
ncbi:MAG: hypothetical protein AAGE92_06670 [Cyanobacteria bacterium P01_G01_bin.4]